MADQERAGRGLRLGEGQDGVLERGRNNPSVAFRDPKSVEHGEMQRGADCPGLGHEPIRSLQHCNDFRVGVTFAGHQRCGQGDLDIELELLALASFG